MLTFYCLLHLLHVLKSCVDSFLRNFTDQRIKCCENLPLICCFTSPKHHLVCAGLLHCKRTLLVCWSASSSRRSPTLWWWRSSTGSMLCGTTLTVWAPAWTCWGGPPTPSTSWPGTRTTVQCSSNTRRDFSTLWWVRSWTRGWPASSVKFSSKLRATREHCSAVSPSRWSLCHHLTRETIQILRTLPSVIIILKWQCVMIMDSSSTRAGHYIPVIFLWQVVTSRDTSAVVSVRLLIIVIICISLDHVTVWWQLYGSSWHVTTVTTVTRDTVTSDILHNKRQTKQKTKHSSNSVRWVKSSSAASFYVHYFNHGLNKCTYNRKCILFVIGTFWANIIDSKRFLLLWLAIMEGKQAIVC